jgi:hypothetical protein
MEGKDREDKESIEDVEIDALDLLQGKMSKVAIGQLHKQISSN